MPTGYNIPGVEDLALNQGSPEARINGSQLADDKALTEVYDIDCSGSADVDISTGSPATLAGQAMCLKLTGTLSGNIHLVLPPIKHAWIIEDAISGVSGAFTVTVVAQSSPPGLSVPFADGDIKFVYSDGVDVISATPRDLFSNIDIVIDGAGSPPSTGSKGYVQVPFDGTIVSWTLLANVSGSAQITVKKSTYSGFPSTSAIDASAHPLLSSAQKNTNATLTGWTTAVTAGDILEFNLDSVTTISRLILQITIKRS